MTSKYVLEIFIRYFQLEILSFCAMYVTVGKSSWHSTA